MAEQQNYIDKIKAAFFPDKKKTETKHSDTSDKGKDTGATKAKSSQSSTPKNKKDNKKALKEALALSRLLNMEQIILNPKKDGNIFEKIKTNVKLGLAADNIPKEELGIPENIIFEDELIRARKSKAGQPILVLDEAIIQSLYDSLDDNQVDEMYDEFWFKIKDKKKMFKGALKYRDFNQINEIAHDLKGTAGNFGLMKISAFARAIEKSSNRQDKEKIGLLLSKMDGLIKQTRSDFINWQSQRILALKTDVETDEQPKTA